MATLHLSRASADDLPAIVEIMFKTYTDPIARDFCLGKDNPEGHKGLVERFAKTMRENPADYWIKIVDQSDNRIIAATNYRIYPTIAPDHANENDRSTPWLKDEPERQRMISGIWDMALDSRVKHFSHPYIEPYFDVTEPGYEGRGGKSQHRHQRTKG